jgi:hypothetical protein
MTIIYFLLLDTIIVDFFSTFSELVLSRRINRGQVFFFKKILSIGYLFNKYYNLYIILFFFIYLYIQKKTRLAV